MGFHSVNQLGISVEKDTILFLSTTFKSLVRNFNTEFEEF